MFVSDEELVLNAQVPYSRVKYAENTAGSVNSKHPHLHVSVIRGPVLDLYQHPLVIKPDR